MFFFYCFNFVIILFVFLLLVLHLKNKEKFPYNFIPNKYEIVMILFILLNQIYVFFYNLFYDKLIEKHFFLFSKLKSLEFIYFQFLIILPILARTNNLINIFNNYFISLSKKFTFNYLNDNNNSFNNSNNISSLNSINNNSINNSIIIENKNNFNLLNFRKFVLSILIYSIFIYIIMGLNDNKIFFEGITFIYYDSKIEKENYYLFGFIFECFLFLIVLMFLIKKISFLFKFPLNSDKFYFKIEIIFYIFIIYLNSYLKIFLILFFFKHKKNKNLSLINDSILNVCLLLLNFILFLKRYFFYRNLIYLNNNKNFYLNFNEIFNINFSIINIFKMYLNKNCDEKINQLNFYLVYLEFKNKYKNYEKNDENENEIHLKIIEIYNQFFNQNSNIKNYEYFFIECPFEIKEKLNNMNKNNFINENLNCFDEVFNWIKNNLEIEFNKFQQNIKEKNIIIKILFFMECFENDNNKNNIFNINLN